MFGGAHDNPWQTVRDGVNVAKACRASLQYLACILALKMSLSMCMNRLEERKLEPTTYVFWPPNGSGPFYIR